MKRVCCWSVVVVCLISITFFWTSQPQSVQTAQAATITTTGCIPRPFLTIPFRNGTKFRLTEGWFYSTEERKIHGYVGHFGLDLAVKYGTPVLAVADGYAIASCHIYYPGRVYQHKKIGFGLGNFVQLWHPDLQVFTQYGHLSKIAPGIPYLVPRASGTGDFDPTGIYKPGSELNLATMKFVRRGEIIGYVGDTGLAWGYDERPGFRPNRQEHPSWDEIHLHFEVYTRGVDGNKNQRWDPCGVYGGDLTKYDLTISNSRELWLRDELGVAYANE